MATIESLVSSDYALSLLVFISSVIIASAASFVLKRYVSAITSKTKTDIDDQILAIVSGPIYFAIILSGAYIALRLLELLSQYLQALDNIFFVCIVFIVTLVVSRLLRVLLGKWLKVQKKQEKTPQLLSRAVSVVVYFIAILVVLSYFEIEITPLVAAFGVGGIAVGLALQNTLSNFFAGLHILSDKPVRINDFVELPESKISGYVEDIGWRSTRIRTLPNTIIIVPNSRLAESIVINDSLPVQEMSVVMQCGVAYGSNLERVEKVTVETAKRMQKKVRGAVKDFEPFIRYHTFGDSNINFSIILRIESFVDQYLLVHEFIKALSKAYKKEGIEISWPVRKLYYGEQPKQKA